MNQASDYLVDHIRSRAGVAELPADVATLLTRISNDFDTTPDVTKFREFAEGYTAAWCSHKPASVASFYSDNGSLSVNSGAPAVGRKAIAEVAQGFFTDFPDLIVLMDDLLAHSNRAVYCWTLIGTNTGPGGRGKRVHIGGFEVWKIGADDLIAESLGFFDSAVYNYQLENGVDAKPE